MTRVGPALICFGITLFGLHRGQARADCAAPRIAVAPRSGAVVPPDPVLHLFVPTWDDQGRPDLEVLSGDRALSWDAARVSATDAFVTYRVTIASGGASSVEVHHGNGVATYRIDPAWRAPQEPFAIAEPERVVDAWTCSHTNAWIVYATPAPAYRVTWNGAERAVVMPRDHADLFGGDSDGAGRIGLGHLSCLGATVPEDELDPSLAVTIEPLYPDGSAGPVWSGTLGAAPPPPPSAATTVAEPAATPVPDRAPSRSRAPILAALLVAALGVGLTVRRFIPGRRRTAAGRGGSG